VLLLEFTNLLTVDIEEAKRREYELWFKNQEKEQEMLEYDCSVKYQEKQQTGIFFGVLQNCKSLLSPLFY